MQNARIKYILLTLLMCCCSNTFAARFNAECEIDRVSCQTEQRPRGPLVLSLNDAILLAVRDNPNVQSSQLSYISQKFNLWVQEWMFHPHYTLQANAMTSRFNDFADRHHHGITAHEYNVQPGVTLLTPIGTQISLSGTVGENGNAHSGLSATITQPLLRGFGRPIVEAALNNARDSEVISCLSVQRVLRTTVTTVIEAYLDVLSAEKTIAIDQAAVKRAEKSVEQTRLYIKGGHKAGNEIITVEANVATAKSQLENDKNNLEQTRYALLTAIGIDPNTKVQFTNLDIDELIDKYYLPSLEETKNLILTNDLQYQIDNITLHGPTCRALLSAEDNTRWQLNFIANGSTSGSRTVNVQNNGQTSVTNNFFTGTQAQSVGLNLTVPIDDQLAKQAVVNAKIALKQAELALMQEKWSIQTNAITGWNNVVSAKRALHFAASAEKLQEKTYNVSYQKYLHGLIDSLELQSAQIQLIQSQQALLYSRISYLKALVKLDLLIGHTLKTWNVKVRL